MSTQRSEFLLSNYVAIVVQQAKTGGAAGAVRMLAEWLKVQGTMSTRGKRDLAAIRRTMEVQQIRALQQKYPRNAQGYKYLDIDKYLPVSLERVYSLNLHRSRPLHVLDIGTGTGYFPYVCKHFGHRVAALDKDDVPAYNEVTDLLEVNRVVWEVNAFEALPRFDQKFDLVTAFRIVFNKHYSAREVWREQEWTYFLRDVANNLLTDRGRVYLDLNPEPDGKHYDRSLLDFLVSNGAKINRSRVYFAALERFRDRVAGLGPAG